MSVPVLITLLKPDYMDQTIWTFLANFSQVEEELPQPISARLGKFILIETGMDLP